MAEEDNSLVLSKHFLHEALTRKGWFLPKKSSGFATLHYLDQVFKGTYWVPRYNEVMLSPCPRPPDVSVLHSEIEHLLNLQGKTLGDTSKSMPDKNFLLTCLSTLAPRHKFFNSSYMPPVKHRSPQITKQIPSYASLFEGLPILTHKQVRRRNLKAHNKLLTLQP